MIQNFFSPRKSILQQYIREAKRYSPLDPKVEKFVIIKVQEGSRRATDILVNSNLMFVIKIAYKYRNQGLELEDIISAGNLGLIEAAKRMDAEKDNKFITYAVWWIRQSIRYTIFNQSRLVRLASNKEEKLRKVFRNSIPIKSYIGGIGVDWEKLKDKIGDDVTQLIPIMHLTEPTISFDMSIGDRDNRKLSETLDSREASPFDILQSKEINQHIEIATSCLDPRETAILEAYFGLHDKKNMSLAQIGESINLSKERVRQIKDSALHKMKNVLSEKSAYVIPSTA